MRKGLLTGVVLIAVAACAARVAPPLPAAPAFPDFVAPTVPAQQALDPAAPRIDEGWRYLQNNRLREAERAFADAARRSPRLAPAHTGLGYVALAERNADGASAHFARALELDPRYAPAMAGRGLALLQLRRDAEAIAAFEAAIAADASLVDLRPRIEAMKLRQVETLLAAGRAAAAAGRPADARAALERALTLAPDSALVYRELAQIERRAGDNAAALTHFRRAIALDPGDVVALVQVGELLESQSDFDGAQAAYVAANELEPSPDLSARIARAAARAREARLPAPFREIPGLPRVTRGDVAALIGVRLEDLVRGMPGRGSVMTDVRGHWAAAWINEVARAGILPAFENHTFQPAAVIRRGDLAGAVSVVVNYLAQDNPSLRARIAQRPTIADVPPGHLSYTAIATAVASGVLDLRPGNRFDITDPVSGRDADAAVDRLRALVTAR